MRNRLYLIAALWALGVVLVLAGLFMTMGTLAEVDNIAGWLEDKRGYVAELRQLEARIAPYLDSKDTMDGLEETKPVPLEDIVAQVTGADENPHIRLVSRTEIEGWTLIRKEVNLNELPVSEIFAAINAAANSGYSGRELQRPAWVLVKCTISSIEARSGWCRAALIFETLSR